MENEEMALAVRRKGKSLKDCMALVLKTAFNAKTQLDDRITKAAGLETTTVYQHSRKGTDQRDRERVLSG